MLLLLVSFTVFVLRALFTLPKFSNQLCSSQMKQLDEILKKIDAIRNQNLELTNLLKSKVNFKHASQKGPNMQYEVLRRRLSSNVAEFWNFLNFEINNAINQTLNLSRKSRHELEHILDMGKQHKRWLLYDIEKLSKIDGFDAWRKNESLELERIVQNRFHHLQNPDDCSEAKKVISDVNRDCGFTCQLHHIGYSFLIAYDTQRTLILKSDSWSYDKKGWNDLFRPLSDSCTNVDGQNISKWTEKLDTQVLYLVSYEFMHPRPMYLPGSIPEDIADRLVRLHGNPLAWWSGQINKYLMKPQESTYIKLKKYMSDLGFKHPIVGVHVRRTDKIGVEASFHSIEEYMIAVDEYYDHLELSEKVNKRRIYLASDDPTLIDEAKSKYPHYEILGNVTNSKSAAVSTRYTPDSLYGLILDIYVLSMTDYIVCTLSSGVCRTAYELMQTYFPDASKNIKSLDDMYWIVGQIVNLQVAVLPHENRTSQEISLVPGDFIDTAANHQNGYSKGRNTRTNRVGRFPSFKVKNLVETAKFPTYAEFEQNISG